MKALQLDFNRPPAQTPWLGLLLTLLGIVAVLWVMTQMDVAKEAKAQQDIQSDQLLLRQKQLDALKKAALTASPVSAKVEKIRQAQSISPTEALSILEQVWQPEIALLRLDVATLENNIKLEIEGKTLNDVLLLVDRLQAHPEIRQVSLARNAIKVGDPHRPITSSIEIFWRAQTLAQHASMPASADERQASAPQGAAR